jgi:hypothetical protein
MESIADLKNNVFVSLKEVFEQIDKFKKEVKTDEEMEAILELESFFKEIEESIGKL